MMQNILLKLVFLLLFCTSCKDQKQQEPSESITPSSYPFLNEKPLDTTQFVYRYLKRLEDSKYVYRHKIDSSYFYNQSDNGLIYNRSKTDTNLDFFREKLLRVDKSIEQQKSYFLERNQLAQYTADYRARLHEYTFANDSIAGANFNYLVHLKKDFPDQWKIVVAWNRPDSIIKRKNRVYHVVTSSSNLPDLPKEIIQIMFH